MQESYEHNGYCLTHSRHGDYAPETNGATGGTKMNNDNAIACDHLRQISRARFTTQDIDGKTSISLFRLRQRTCREMGVVAGV